MDLSALIFVALALAWGVYLVPKALRHHEDDADTRDVDGFSERLRVLARRDAVSARGTALVRPDAGRDAETDASLEDDELAEPAAPTPAPRADRSAGERSVRPAGRPSERPALSPEERRRRRARQASARRAAARRRRVLLVLLLPLVVVAVLAAAGVLAPVWTAAPAALVVAWLVLCRVMVRRERARAARSARRRPTLADQVMAEEDAALAEADEATAEAEVADVGDLDDGPGTDLIPVVPAAPASAGWAPVQVPLPTYVAKAPAGRTVRTIDLDATGVWSSGRNEADSALAREAEARASEAREAKESGDAERRASGS